MARTSGRRRQVARRAVEAQTGDSDPLAVATLSHPEADGARHANGAEAGPRALEGNVDRAIPGQISGWVWDSRAPDQRVILDLVDNDKRLARIVADEYRHDLEEAGIGDGRHAFRIPLPPELLAAERNLLHLRCATTGCEVPGSPFVVIREPAAPEESGAEKTEEAFPGAETVDDRRDRPEADPIDSGDAAATDAIVETAAPRMAGEWPGIADPETGLHGNIDEADWTGIRGWVWNPRDPDERVTLELFDGDTFLARAIANQYRRDLEECGIGDGRFGFAITFAATLLPNARHELHLRAAGARGDFLGQRIELRRDERGFDTTVRFLLGNIAAEAERADSADQLVPVITALVDCLDCVLPRYFELTADAGAKATELLNPAALSAQFGAMVDSMQWNYPPISLDTSHAPIVSIVIPVFNKFDLTYACVKSIAEHGARVPFEIIIVDDASRDETMLASFAFGRGIRLIRNDGNAGFIRSCNRGFDLARGEYVVFLNNDTEVKPRWLDELYETMQRDPTIGIVGAKLLYPDGTLQESGGIIWRLGDAWNWGRGQAADDPRYCYMRDADYVSGAALMVRSKLFAAAGKFDEHYLPAYYEDTELCFRVRQLGYRVVVQPAAEVVHFEGASAGTDIAGSGMKRFQAVNHRKFFERWKDALATHRFNGEFPELEVERTVRQRAIFIDDSVPEPDKDAGSNAAFQHMLSLQRLGYKVTFIPGDNMARIDPYTAALQRRGIECLYHPYFASVEDVFRRYQLPVDLVYLHRYSNASKYAGMVRQHFPKARIIYNVADLHFLRAQREAELRNDRALHDRVDTLRRLELGAMSFVDCVIVHSAAEAELLQRIAPQIEVRVIPWTVPLREPRAEAGQRRELPTIAFIGGFRHPPNVDAAKWTAQSIMPELRKRLPGAELLLVGSNMPQEVAALAAKDIVPLGYVPSLDSVLERVRLTIAPLRFGAGLKGKVLESLAAGVPCVMTSISAEGIDLPPELARLVADDPAGLAEKIAELCQDDDRYRRAAEAGRALIEANYSADRIDQQLRAACGLE